MKAYIEGEHDVEILSFGGGVQTLGMLALIENGVLDKPDYAVFADTGVEMPHTYAYIEQVAKPWCAELGFKFVIASAGNLETVYRSKNPVQYANVTDRRCTDHYKIRPIRRWMRSMGFKHPRVWIGISADEKDRAVAARVKWAVNYFPLLQPHLMLTRADLYEVVLASGRPEPLKSGCYMCPFQSHRSWKLLSLRHPDLFDRVLAWQVEAESGLGAKGCDVARFDMRGIVDPDEFYADIPPYDPNNPFETCSSGWCIQAGADWSKDFPV